MSKCNGITFSLLPVPCNRFIKSINIYIIKQISGIFFSEVYFVSMQTLLKCMLSKDKFPASDHHKVCLRAYNSLFNLSGFCLVSNNVIT
jgi:hypothetical protein